MLLRRSVGSPSTVLAGLIASTFLLFSYCFWHLYGDDFPVPLDFGLRAPTPVKIEQSHPEQSAEVAKLRAQLLEPHTPYPPSEAGYLYKFDHRKGGYKWYTESRLRALAACAGRNDCHPNAYKVAIFASLHCHMAVFDGYGGGEGVWCRGMMSSLERQGYTVLLARNDWDYIYHIHRQIPDLVRAIIAYPVGHDAPDYPSYLKGTQGEGEADGIPAWKFFYFYYYPSFFTTIVGQKWTVAAEPKDGATYTYLGYSLENVAPTIPFQERPHRVYILGKYSWFFHKKSPMSNVVWEFDWFQKIIDELKQRWPDFEIVGGITDPRNEAEIEKEGEFPVPPGIINLGKLDPEQFDAELGKARLLLGIGFPGLSPSPYRALARGVPFLNPHSGGDSWQHNTLQNLGEPHVYNVEAFDYEGLKNAIARAMEVEAKPWFAPWMTREAADARMRDFMEHDWRSDAAVILEERKKGNETQEQHGDLKLGLFEL